MDWTILRWRFISIAGLLCAIFPLYVSAIGNQNLAYTQYAPGDPISLECYYPTSSVQLFDVTSGFASWPSPINETNLGNFPCGSSVSFGGIDGHSYALLEITPGGDCTGLYYGSCSGQNFVQGEANFTVGSPAIANPSYVPGGGPPINPPPGNGGSTPAPASSATVAKTVTVTCQFSGSSLQLFDVSSNVVSWPSPISSTNLGNFPCGSPVSFTGIVGDSYALLELASGGDCSGLYYGGCVSQSFFIAETDFSVSAVTAGVIVTPTATITSPVAGDVISHTGKIRYTTLNAAMGVNLYYSTTTAEWDGSSFVSPRDEVLIASGVPESGTYVWDTKGLTPGDLYRIIVDALGTDGHMGEAVSGLFSIDLTPPTFVVSANPPVTRGNDVTISVDASEDLGVPPIVMVTQSGGPASPVSMMGKGSHYEGVYVIKKGYDGVATIGVSGADRAGNAGTTILSGGTFAVGVNPPPAPHISSPQANTVVATSTISVSGTTRADTTIRLIVNGVDTYAASSSASGAFSITGITLSPTNDRGANIVSVVALDVTGLASPAVPLRLKYEIAPTIAVIAPVAETTVTATVPLSVRATDGNGDPLLFTYQIIPAQDFIAAASATSTSNVWTTIASAVPSNSFAWDSTEAEDGQYFLRVIADDGFVKAYSAPTSFSIHNTLSFFRFEDGRKTVTNHATVTIKGRALAPAAISPSPSISTVEYSLNNGVTWKPVTLASGAGTPSATFSVTLSDLREGAQGILWRVKDSRGFYGRASHPVIVDMTPPAAPIVNAPANNAFVTDSQDEDASKSGLQISVSGSAEPQSIVTLATASTTVTTRASVTGTFAFRSVDISHRGANQLTVTAADEAGNESAVSTVQVMYDNPPAVMILSPKPSRGLTGKATVSWQVSDADADPIRSVALSWRRGQGVFAELPIDAGKSSFLFDVSAFPEGSDYQLRIAASDGMATSTDLVNFSVDRTPPTLSSFVLDMAVLRKGDTLTGHGAAHDALSGIEYVEYAVTEGKPVSFSTALLTDGFLQANATFTIAHPTTLPDGTYTVYARAVDAAGNVSPALSQTITVDTMPPHVGSFDVVAEGIHVSPDAQGVIPLFAGTQALFEISLEGDTASASLTIGTTTVSLLKDIASGLWQATVVTGRAGTTTLAVSAKDAVGNAFSAKSIGAFFITDRPVAVASAQPEANAPSGFWGFLQGIIKYLLSL